MCQCFVLLYISRRAVVFSLEHLYSGPGTWTRYMYGELVVLGHRAAQGPSQPIGDTIYLSVSLPLYLLSSVSSIFHFSAIMSQNSLPNEPVPPTIPSSL